MVSMDIRSWAMLILLAVVWGAAFVLVGFAVEFLPVLTVAALRVGIAGMGLLLLCLVLRVRLPSSTADWGTLAIMGLLNNVVPFGLITFGQTYVASGLASVLNAMTPICALLVGWAVLRVETMTAPKVAGLAAALAGVAVLSGPEALRGLGGDLPGQAAILGAALS